MKKWNWNNKYIGWGVTAFLVLLGILISYYLLFHVENLLKNVGKIINILMPVIFGLGIAYMLTPVLNYLEHRIFMPFCSKLGWKESKHRDGILRIVCILLTVIMFFAIIYSLIYMMVSEIVPSVMNIASNFDVYVNNITVWLNKLLEDNPMLRDYTMKIVDNYSVELNEWFNSKVLTKTTEVLKVVTLGVWGSIKVIWNLIIGIIISIYVMMNKEKFSGQLKKIIYAFHDQNNANILINNFKFTHNTFSGFLGGKILDSFVIGCLCFMGTVLMRTPYAALISVIIGVTNIIPFFGPSLGAIPSIILIFIVDPMNPLNCIYFAIFILILQQFDGNILGPKILGNSTGLTSFWVIFAITFFGGLWGVFGMLVGVPIFAVIYAAIKSIINTKLTKKNLPTDSDVYTYVCAIDDQGIHTYIPAYKINTKQKLIYQYGDRFISDSDEIIVGEQMKQVKKIPNKERNASADKSKKQKAAKQQQKNNDQSTQQTDSNDKSQNQ